MTLKYYGNYKVVAIQELGAKSNEQMFTHQIYFPKNQRCITKVICFLMILALLRRF